MADRVRAAVLVGPGRYELQEFPYPRLADGALVLQVEPRLAEEARIRADLSVPAIPVAARST